MQSERLTVDELALVLSTMGNEDLARELLFVGDETPNADVGQGRLLAAGHSLLARRLCDLDEAGRLKMDQSLTELVSPLAGADFSLRAFAATASASDATAFHFLGEQIVQHTLERELLHDLLRLPGDDPIDDVVGALIVRFGLDGIAPFIAPESGISPTVLAQVRAAESEAEQRRLLAIAGVHELTRDLFLRDFREAQFEGSVLRVDFRQGEEGYSDFGMLLFRGPERLWILRIEPSPGSEEAEITIMPGDVEVFAREVRLLVDRSTN